MPQHQFTASYYMRIKRININRQGESPAQYRRMSEDELRGCMSSLIVRHPYFKLFFDYGFGHNHMWVKASGSLERLILVEF